MTLAARIAARQTCAVTGCDRRRAPDSLFCSEHLTDMWRNRLDRQADGTFVAARRFAPKDMTRSAA